MTVSRNGQNLRTEAKKSRKDLGKFLDDDCFGRSLSSKAVKFVYPPELQGLEESPIRKNTLTFE